MFDKEKALTWLDEKWPIDKRKCEICTAEHWTLAEDIVTPSIYQQNAVLVGEKCYPQFLVVCNNCGNTKYFNSVIPGLVKGLQKNG